MAKGLRRTLAASRDSKVAVGVSGRTLPRGEVAVRRERAGRTPHPDLQSTPVRNAVPNAYIRRSLLTVSPRSTRGQTHVAPEARGAIEAFRDCGWSVTVVGGTRELRA